MEQLLSRLQVEGTAPGEFGCDLEAGVACADDQHVTPRELLRIAVLAAVDPGAAVAME